MFLSVVGITHRFTAGVIGVNFLTASRTRCHIWMTATTFDDPELIELVAAMMNW